MDQEHVTKFEAKEGIGEVKWIKASFPSILQTGAGSNLATATWDLDS